MRTAFVQIASLFLLVCISLHTTGLYFAFRYYQSELKREMKQSLSGDLKHERVMVLEYNAANASAFEFEGEQEFTHNGKMYDVIRKEKKNGKTIIYCVDDKKETQLVQTFLKQHKADRSCKAKMQGLGQFLSTTYISTTYTGIIKFSPHSIKHRSRCLCFYPEAESEVLKPPPQVLA